MVEINMEQLKKINQNYLNAHHSIEKEDLENIKKLINLIEITRDNTQPKIGDTVRFTSKNGKYVCKNGKIVICEKPYTPFFKEYDKKKNDISLSVSGGTFHILEANMFKYLKKYKRKFCNWGVCGACFNESINFLAMVNVWEVNENIENT